MPAGVEQLQSNYRCWIAVICLSECRRSGAVRRVKISVRFLKFKILGNPTPILPFPLAALFR
jgi:hypothetical protein